MSILCFHRLTWLPTGHWSPKASFEKMETNLGESASPQDTSRPGGSLTLSHREREASVVASSPQDESSPSGRLAPPGASEPLRRLVLPRPDLEPLRLLAQTWALGTSHPLSKEGPKLQAKEIKNKTRQENTKQQTNKNKHLSAFQFKSYPKKIKPHQTKKTKVLKLTSRKTVY